MNAIVAAMIDAMRDDETLAGMVGTFQDEPCIFYGPTAPVNVGNQPYAVMIGPKPNNPWMSKGTTVGFDSTFTVICVAPKKYTKRAMDMARQVFGVFHRQSLTIEGHHCQGIRCSGPEMAEYDQEVSTFTVTVNVKTNESESESEE